MKEIGTVISSETGPNSQEFWFVLNDNKGIPVRKGQFVQLNTQDGILVARVEDIIKTNRYYQRAESVSEFERSGRPLIEQFPVDRWEYLIAEAFPLGMISNGVQRRVTFPPSPGNDVYPVDEQLLHSILGLDVNSGLNIGKIEFHNVDAKLNVTRLFQKHLAILAMSGAGKSYTVSILLEELLNKERNFRPSVILIDPHGEYGGFAADEKYRKSTKVYEGEQITIATNTLSAYQLSILMPKITAVQRRELNPILRKLREEKPAYNMQDLIEAVLNSDIKDVKTKSVLASWLHELEYTKLFSNRDYPSVKDLAYQGNLSIFDLSDIVDIKRKQIIVSYFGWKLFEARRQKKISPFVLFVEEAHQFSPEGEERESAISRRIIEQIAREGRKFNACIVLITQRPAGLATTALSQCNTNIIMRVTNPNDLDHIKESSEGITGGVLDSIPGLKVGEAYIVGEAVNYPILVNVRERKSKSSEKGKRLEDEIADFNNSKIDDKDLETFM
ncbi:MAG: ATP-binding protein [Candidatus Aenigmarchaeota archaeon]|nr:ATP-binding protein [Candidatus Aenigmarchaeota archaeon]